jgi:hypothetical protein
MWSSKLAINDNNMKNFELGSILKQRDYTKHNRIGLILSIGVCSKDYVAAEGSVSRTNGFEAVVPRSTHDCI